MFPIILCGQTFGKRYEERYEAGEKIEETQQLNELREEGVILERPIDPNKYILGPGDKITISILAEDKINITNTISPIGEVFIPYIGVISVNGLTFDEAKTQIINYIKSEAIHNAKISVTLQDLRKFKIQITGAVIEPGFYDITPVTRLSEIIKRAEGFHQMAKEFSIIVTHMSGETEIINYLDYFRNGNLSNNPTFIEGDRIYVPFGNVEKEAVVIRGSISGRGYDIIEKDESLESFLNRRAEFDENADLNMVVVTRNIDGKEKIFVVQPGEFSSMKLLAGDQIDIMHERGVSVIGFVQNPGGFNYYPGYTLMDYIGLAGGNSPEGDASRSLVKHLNGKVEKGENIEILRGDIIEVPRTFKNILFGDVSVLQIITSVCTVILTYIAATSTN
jgi:protein involved in polysaccharide export with SLBB domain